MKRKQIIIWKATNYLAINKISDEEDLLLLLQKEIKWLN
jgi:hypothetical protein